MIWEEYRINYLSTKYNYIFSRFCIDTKQVKKFIYIYTVLLQPVQIQAWFQKVLFFPVRGTSVAMRKQSIMRKIFIVPKRLSLKGDIYFYYIYIADADDSNA